MKINIRNLNLEHRMQLRYEDDLLEAAIFATSRKQASLQIRRYHAERERLYLILDPDERNEAFFRLHLEWFREWGMERTLISVVDEFALLRGGLGTLVFRAARLKKDEGAELYVSQENVRSAVVAFRPERFLDDAELRRFLRHEFTHVHDMLDPGFGYSPGLDLPGQNAAQQRLTRERYRLLWDITIDGRLERANRGGDNRDRYRADFDRAFGFWSEPKREEIFSDLWSRHNPRHSALLELAADPRGTRTTNEPAPGALCPLCGFSTFDWAAADRLKSATPAIRAEFPDWTPDRGACRRCVEVYKVLNPPLAIAL